MGRGSKVGLKKGRKKDWRKNKYLNKLQILREGEERDRKETRAKNKENNRV